jgi:hypothetical protein
MLLQHGNREQSPAASPLARNGSDVKRHRASERLPRDRDPLRLKLVTATAGFLADFT